jgi:RNase P/RNase MRP subunit p29
MKELVGLEIKVVVDGVGQVAGTLVADQRDIILVKGKDGKVARIPKSHIAMFVPEKEPKGASIGLHVLYCENIQMPCQGVQYIKAGEGFTRTDFDKFMGACP